ncbi:hypothetical protein PR048_025082 [Dryococelus australis]|uniref:Uncharacterized protein n=1 Tax=Dryococelus australis TaxID=614101 RepID=A0ABQ9GQG1_9NEOP|nr:hypothetical protein PR048_025082 [Dryococelus australis]
MQSRGEIQRRGKRNIPEKAAGDSPSCLFTYEIRGPRHESNPVSLDERRKLKRRLGTSARARSHIPTCANKKIQYGGRDKPDGATGKDSSRKYFTRALWNKTVTVTEVEKGDLRGGTASHMDSLRCLRKSKLTCRLFTVNGQAVSPVAPVKDVQGEVSTFEINLRKKSLPLLAYIMSALSGRKTEKLADSSTYVVNTLRVFLEVVSTKTSSNNVHAEHAHTRNKKWKRRESELLPSRLAEKEALYTLTRNPLGPTHGLPKGANFRSQRCGEPSFVPAESRTPTINKARATGWSFSQSSPRIHVPARTPNTTRRLFNPPSTTASAVIRAKSLQAAGVQACSVGLQSTFTCAFAFMRQPASLCTAAFPLVYSSHNVRSVPPTLGSFRRCQLLGGELP